MCKCINVYMYIWLHKNMFIYMPSQQESEDVSYYLLRISFALVRSAYSAMYSKGFALEFCVNKYCNKLIKYINNILMCFTEYSDHVVKFQYDWFHKP